jgi:hypothetical protein
MNRYGFLLATAIVATLAAGCATNGGTSSAANDDDKLIVTGSRIPVKGSATGNVSVDSDKNSINDMMRRPGTAGSSAN